MNESIYDQLRREWAARFSTGDEDSQEASNNSRESARGSEQAVRLTESHARMGPFKAACRNSFF